MKHDKQWPLVLTCENSFSHAKDKNEILDDYKILNS